MNKSLLVSLVFLFASTASMHGQDMITNHSFEEWDEVPVGWINPLFGVGVQNVVQSTDAQDGSLSVKLVVLWNDNLGGYVPVSLNSLPNVVTENHASLYGYYKGTSVGGDMLTVSVFVYNDGMIAGTGFFNTTTSTSEWTQFSVPINYVGSIVGSEAYIYFIVNGDDDLVHDGTEFFVDNMSWDGSTGINDRMLVHDVTVSPNPANSHFELQFTLEAPDRLTFDLVTPQGNVRSIRSDASYRAGNNALQVNTSALPGGIYMIRAQGERYSFVKKIVVAR